MPEVTEQDRMQEALLKLDLKDGDIVFFDAHVLDPSNLFEIPDPLNRNVTFVVVQPLIGKSIKDSIYRMSRKELLDLAGVPSA